MVSSNSIMSSVMLLNYLKKPKKMVILPRVCVCMCARTILADLCDEPMFVSAVWVLHISKGALILVASHSY